MAGDTYSMEKARNAAKVKRDQKKREATAEIIRSVGRYLDAQGETTNILHIYVYAEKVEDGTLTPADFAAPPAEEQLIAVSYDYVPGSKSGPWSDAGAHPFFDDKEGNCTVCEEPESTMCHPHNYRESDWKGLCMCGRPPGSIAHWRENIGQH